MLTIYEDEEFRDEPLSNDPEAVDEYDYKYLDHIYTYDLPETKQIALDEFYQTVKDYAAVAADGEDRVDMLESYESPLDSLELFLYSDFPFNMIFIEDGEGTFFEPSADSVKESIDAVVADTPPDKVPNWVVSVGDFPIKIKERE